MSFQLQCAVARIEGDLAEQVLAFARTIRFVQTARISEPFAGVIAGYNPEIAQETISDEAIAAGATEDDASEAGAQAYWDGLAPLPAAFPDVRFAMILCDCSGGTCLYSGHTTGPGERVDANGSDAHQRLLAALGAVDPAWYFAPFTRGFFERGEPPSGPPRREVRCTIGGVLDAAVVGVALLVPPWRVTSYSERHAIVVHGDDLYLSLNLQGDALDLRVSSHLESDPTTALIAELADTICAHGELVVRDAAGTVLCTITV